MVDVERETDRRKIIIYEQDASWTNFFSKPLVLHKNREATGRRLITIITTKD